MTWWAYALIAILAVAVMVLAVKLHLLRKSLREMQQGLDACLAQQTNTLIGISSHDSCARSMAAALNGQLAELRAQRHRYQMGDAELKNAVVSISHDLRTPLTAICGYLELLEPLQKSDTVERYLAVIAGRVEAMRQLTDQLFRYSVIVSQESDAGADAQTAAVDVGAVLQESIAGFYAALVERGIESAVTLPNTPVTRHVDAAALSRIFANLLGNAVKYSDGDLDITLASNGSITFSNSAAGLDEVQVGRLFDRFYTVEAARNSTGLGLSIARTLATRLGGTLSATYEYDRLTIRLQLP